MDRKYFYCYSYNLKTFLCENGLRYITNSVNSNTQKKFWLFERTEQLCGLLDVWRERKH